ncbi:DUF4138 domain-containing protein [Chryseobacterium culicis]|uniref:DUF4138 domain-containing protein n=1 Tax=Chryseobacterium culicis TaxID=680127 RepID=A0A2S9CZ73_CHRCI|nr:DUF4138 domain-containing protein [Chryseobacterium culicis]PRB85774.1 hypothetical protein CQ022_05830 [Chryseobacterium culicis]PRB90502.1 hypothetical protein CQ033_07155 [Chryseobacterium culicis]
MKKHIVLFILFFLCSQGSFAQEILEPLSQRQAIEVSDVKTTHIIFDEKIKYVDVGSTYFVADTIGNMLKLKHTGEELENPKSQQANLTVINGKGSYYSIDMGYSRDPDITTYKAVETNTKIDYFAKESINKIEKEERTAQDLQELCMLSESAPSTVKIKDNNDGLNLTLNGIYYRNFQNKIVLRVEIYNTSKITLDIDQILFRSKLKNNNAAKKDYVYQERILTPVKSCGDQRNIKLGETRILTFIFDKFTLNEDEILSLEVGEYAGGRSVNIRIPRKKLLFPEYI